MNIIQIILNLFAETEAVLSEIKNEYRIRRAVAEAQNKMVDEFNNLQQLFIAV